MDATIPNGTLDPARLMAAIRGALKGWADGAGLVFLEASDPFNVWDLLQAHPSGGCVATLWEGDNVRSQAGRSVVVDNEVSITVTKPTHPRMRAAALSDSQTAAYAPLLSIVSEVRSRMLSLHVEGVQAEFRYGACAPAVAPTGIPLDGYRLTFRLLAAVACARPEGVPLRT